MELSSREFWGLVHGMVLGAFFLVAFAGGLAELYGLRTRWNTEEGIVGRVRRLTVGYWVMAVSTRGIARSSLVTISRAAQGWRSPVRARARRATSSSPT